MSQPSACSSERRTERKDYFEFFSHQTDHPTSDSAPDADIDPSMPISSSQKPTITVNTQTNSLVGTNARHRRSSQRLLECQADHVRDRYDETFRITDDQQPGDYDPI